MQIGQPRIEIKRAAKTSGYRIGHCQSNWRRLIKLLPLILLSLLWHTNVSSQSSTVENPSPWIGTSNGIARLENPGALSTRFPLSTAVPSTGIDCSAIEPWRFTLYFRGDVVEFLGSAFEVNRRRTFLPPLDRFSGPRGSFRPWIRLGECSAGDSEQPTQSGVVGLVEKQNQLWAYLSDHRLVLADTASDQISEIPLPVLPDTQGRDCAAYERWNVNQTYARRDRVSSNGHGWRAIRQTTSKPLLQDQGANRRDWRYLGICALPIDFAGHLVTDTDVVWVARGTQLVRSELGIAEEWILDAPINQIAWDETSQQLWVATGTSLERRSASGDVFELIELTTAPVESMAIEPESGLLWINAVDGTVSQRDSNGVLMDEINLPLTAIQQIVPDQQGNMWVASANTVLKVESVGTILETLSPAIGASEIINIAIAGDGSLWIATSDQLWRYGENEGLQQQWAADATTLDVINVLGQPTSLNAVPEITSSPVTEGSIDEEYVYGVTAIDSDGEALTFELELAPDGMEIDAVSGEITWTPSADGEFEVVVAVSDESGGVARQEYTLVVDADVDAPVITISSPTSGSSTDLASISVSGVINEPATVTVNGQPATVNANNQFSVDNIALTEGGNTITVVATDEAGNVASISLTITRVVNQPPQITSSPDIEGLVGTAYQYQVAALDPENDGLTFSLIQGPNGMSIGDQSGLVQWTPQEVGNFPVTLSVSDGVNNAVTQSYSISVSVPNTPPQFITSALPAGATDVPYQTAVDAVDAENDAISFSLQSGPANLVINSQGVIEWLPETAGTFLLVVRATDARGAFRDQQYQLVIAQSNRPPLISSTPLVNVIVQQLYSYQVVATDADLDELEYRLLSAPLGMNIDRRTGLVTWTAIAPSTELIRIEVRDGDGEIAIQEYNLAATIDPTNQPPEFAELPDQVVPVGSTLNLQLAASDPEASGIRYEINPMPLPNGFTFNVMTGLFVIEPGVEQVGQYSFQIIATDSFNRIERTLNVTVPPVDLNQPTNLSGRILDANSANESGVEIPLVGATVAFLDGSVSTITDADGYFVLANIPANAEIFSIDGSTANNAPDGTGYASFIEKLAVIQNVDNIEDRPFYMPRIETASLQQITPGQDAIVNNARLDVTLEVPADTAVHSDGTPFTGEISISEVPPELAPAALPEIYDPELLITIQPAGIEFTEPLAITWPNRMQLAPGSEVDIMSVNPDTGVFESVGIGRVTADGANIETISGGIVAADWHFTDIGSIANSTVELNENPQTCEAKTGSYTCLHDGRLSQVDTLPAYRSLEQSRTYQFIYQSHRAGYSDSLPDPIEPPTLDVNTTVRPRASSRRVSSHNAQTTTTYRSVRTSGARGASFTPPITEYTVNIGGVVTGAYFNYPPGIRAISRFPLPLVVGYLPIESYNIQSGIYDVELLTRLYAGPVGNRSGSGVVRQFPILITNESNSPFGAGWMLSGLSRLSIQESTGHALFISPEGIDRFYRFDNGTQTFTTPDADFSTLVREADGSFTHTDKYGTRLTFTAEGIQTTSTDRNNNVTQFLYDGSNRLIRIIDPVGLETVLTYANGRINSLTDPAGRTTRFQHDSLGNLREIEYPDGSEKRYGYNGSFMSRKIDENGNETRYFYDENGFNVLAQLPDQSTRIVESAVSRTFSLETEEEAIAREPEEGGALDDNEQRIAAKINARGFRTEYELDEHSRITRILDAVGRETVNVLDDDSLPTRTTRPNGSRITRSFDALGNPTRVTENFNGAVYGYSYDTNSLVTSVTNPRGHTLTLVRDPNGNPTQLINELGHTLTTDFDTRGLPTRTLTPNGLETIYTYTASGLIETLTETPPAGSPGEVRVTSFSYYPTGLVEQTNMPDGRTYRYTYDERNRLLTTTDNLGQVASREYDEYGNVVATTVRSADASNALVARMTYDSRNRFEESRLPHDNGLDSITRLALDGESNITNLTDPNTNPDGWVFDAVDRVSTHTDPLTGETATAYDTNDRVTRVEGPTGIVTEYTYDLIGRVLTEVSPDRGTQQYRYDRANNMIEMTDGRGVISTFSYDRLERLQSKTFPFSANAGREDVSYSYDSCELGIGRLCSIDDESGSSTYGYDAWGNIVSRAFTEAGGTVFNTAYRYDNGNHVTSTTYPSGRVLAFDRDGQRRVSDIQAVVNGSPQFIMRDITYRGDNQMLTCTYGNGLEDQRTYDLQGRLRTQLLTNTSGATVDTRSYGYDRNSNLLSVQTNFENNNYVYDPKDRVQNDIIDAINNTLYDYDLNNNRLSSSVTDSGAAAGSDVYQYNPDSNQINYVESFREETIDDIQQANRRMVYNDVGRLFQLYESDELTAEYIYNESGQRIRKTLFAGGIETATTIFHYNLSGLLISETDRDGNLIRDYIWSEAGHPVAQIDSAGGADNLTYLHQDHLMTNRLGTDENQQVVWRWEGEAFGSTPAIEDAGIVVNLRFPGQYYDGETGWFYNWNRYYDPRIGRYISSDPIGLYGGGNTYSYANQNALNSYDYLGLKPGDLFDTREDAREDRDNYLDSLDDGREYFAPIIEIDGCYTYSALPLDEMQIGMAPNPSKVLAASGRGLWSLLKAAGGKVKNQRKKDIFAPGGRERAKELFRKFDTAEKRTVVRENDGSRAILGKLGDGTPMRLRLKVKGPTRIQAGPKKIQFNE